MACYFICLWKLSPELVDKSLTSFLLDLLCSAPVVIFSKLLPELPQLGRRESRGCAERNEEGADGAREVLRFISQHRLPLSMKIISRKNISTDAIARNEGRQSWLFWETLIFVIGDFENREQLRQQLIQPQDKSAANEHPFKERPGWFDATFAADQKPGDTDYIRRKVDLYGPDNASALYIFQTREREVLLITREVQEGIRKQIRDATAPIGDKDGVFNVFKYGGIIPYAHYYLRCCYREQQDLSKTAAKSHPPRTIEPPKQGKILAIVVDEHNSSAGNLESTLEAEFAGKADVFMSGVRTGEEYLPLIKAWFRGKINPKNYESTHFNPDRFKQTKTGLLEPSHNYRPMRIAKPLADLYFI
ncbi:MAG: hypothetical protein V1702_06365 [Candidatus Woesearchaeota archaeon]